MANISVVSTGTRKKEERNNRDLTGAGPQADFVSTAMRRFKGVDEDESDMREDMIDDLEFRFNIDDAQWDEADLRNRKADARPTVTINRIPQFIRQVTNQMRSSRMSIQVNPVDSAGDMATAEALQGVIRNIENNSDSDIAYSTGGEHQCTIGRGYWRILTEWVEEDEFNQHILIREIQNPFSVFVDTAHQRFDASDARFAFILERVPKDDYDELYGSESRMMYDSFNTRGNRSHTWNGNQDGYLIAEYFYKEFTDDVIVELIIEDKSQPGGSTSINVSKSDLPKGELPQGWKVRNERKVRRSQCKWAKISPVEVLDGNDAKTAGRDFPSRHIPIVQVLGDMYNIDGRRDLRGMVRDARSPMKMYNYWASALTEMIGLSPRAPYIGYEGSFKGHENKWNMANRKNFAYLEVAAVTIAGQPAPLPTRQQFDPAIQSLVTAFQLADNDLKAVMGLYDASLGQQGPEQSGKAILARQRQGEIGNSNYLDNMSRAIRYTGKILLDMIPRVYTPNRIMRILGSDNQQEAIIIHTGMPAKDIDALQASTGINRIYDVSVGRYDVNISTGPNFASRRQEAVTALLELLDKSKDERMASAVSDILVRNMDWPGAQEIAARLKRMVPEELLGPQEGGGKPKVPPEVQKKMKEMEQELAELRAEAKIKMAEIQSKEKVALQKAQSSQQIQTAKAQAAVQMAQMKMQQAEQMERMSNEFESMLANLKRQHTARMQQEKIDAQREIEYNQRESEILASTIAAQADRDTSTIEAEARTDSADIEAVSDVKAATITADARLKTADIAAKAAVKAAAMKPKTPESSARPKGPKDE